MRTLGIEPVEADPGLVTFRLDLGEFHLNPFGIVHGGVLAALMDTAMGCAVHSLLPAAVGYVTGELNVRFLRPALLAAGRWSAPARSSTRARARWWPPLASPTGTNGSSPSPAQRVWYGEPEMSADAALLPRRSPRLPDRRAKNGTLILGGGFGGAHVARLLGTAAPPSSTPRGAMLFTPLLPEVAAGAIEPRHVFVPLRVMCPRAALLRGRASALDQTARTVTVEDRDRARRVAYRRLVIALGSTSRMLPIPGLAEPRPDVQGPGRCHPPAQPCRPPARPRRGRPASAAAT